MDETLAVMLAAGKVRTTAALKAFQMDGRLAVETGALMVVTMVVKSASMMVGYWVSYLVVPTVAVMDNRWAVRMEEWMEEMMAEHLVCCSVGMLAEESAGMMVVEMVLQLASELADLLVYQMAVLMVCWSGVQLVGSMALQSVGSKVDQSGGLSAAWMVVMWAANWGGKLDAMMVAHSVFWTVLQLAGRKECLSVDLTAALSV